eukprot:gene23142-biopygen17786
MENTVDPKQGCQYETEGVHARVPRWVGGYTLLNGHVPSVGVREECESALQGGRQAQIFTPTSRRLRRRFPNSPAPSAPLFPTSPAPLAPFCIVGPHWVAVLWCGGVVVLVCVGLVGLRKAEQNRAEQNRTEQTLLSTPRQQAMRQSNFSKS